MTKTISFSLTIALVTMFTLMIAAQPAAASGKSACAPGTNSELLVAFYSGTGSPTPAGNVTNLGGAISGGFYGNTSNAGIDSDAPASGKGVTPSISPGPKVVSGGDVIDGSSLGAFLNYSFENELCVGS